MRLRPPAGTANVRRDHILRSGVQRGRADHACVCLRAVDPPSGAAEDRAGAWGGPTV